MRKPYHYTKPHPGNPGPRPRLCRDIAKALIDGSEFVTECGCQIWMRKLDSRGYGQIYALGKYRRASRMSWLTSKGPIPEGLCVLHRCDIPACINPEHLFLGTLTDNSQDTLRKGRAVVFGRRIPARSL